MATATPARRSTHRSTHRSARTNRTTHTTSANPLHLWHLLSLDAPTVATLWTCFIARTAHLQLPLASALAMFLAVWTLYAADRLLDSRQLVSNPLHTHNLEPRHLFHHRHAKAFLTAILLSSIALAVILPRIPAEAIHLYLILGSFLVAYFILIHATSSSHRLPKEFAVGLFFAAATFIPTVARRPDIRLPLLPRRSSSPPSAVSTASSSTPGNTPRTTPTRPPTKLPASPSAIFRSSPQSPSSSASPSRCSTTPPPGPSPPPVPSPSLYSSHSTSAAIRSPTPLSAPQPTSRSSRPPSCSPS